MKRLLFLILFLAASPALGQVSQLNPIKNSTLDELRQNFVQPHRDYSTGPLWTWNDRLTEEQVRSTLQDLAGQNVKQVWVHPRPGLMTPYLSKEWFELWKVSLDEAEKLDMNVWIYDENSYPSGFAGGFLPEALPDSRGMGLRFEEVEKLDSIDENIWYIFDAERKNITESVKNAGQAPPLTDNQRYLIGRVHYTPAGGWFGGKWYVDLLKKGVTEKFIEITNEAYKREIGEHFGKRVPGIFTDEPHPAGSYVGTWVSWNEEIPELFEEKFGYSLIENLPSLHKPVGDWKKVRHNYHALILDLFVERWAKPNFEWCEENNLEWTGHYWEHGWPGTSHGPDNMAMYIWHQRPAIDLLMNTYNDTSPNAQFGNVRAVKELASIANQMGRSRTLSENYGAGGWDLRFEDMKRLGDWSYALGVNTNNEHLSYVTIRGARKRDHPQSFSYHVPWFEGYHTLADYFTRLSYVLSQGRQVNRIVVIEPTTTAWMYQGEPKLQEIAQSFTDLVNALEHAQVEYDLASEDTIVRFGKVEDKTFFINLGEYDLVILPPNMENLEFATAWHLADYVGNGGRLLYTGDLPTRLDGVEFDAEDAALLKSLAELPNVEKVSVAEAVTAAKVRTAETGLSITVPEGTRSIFHHRRTLPDCEILFICNADMVQSVPVTLNLTSNKIFSIWNLTNGDIIANNMHRINNFHFEMPPSASVLYILSDTAIPDGTPAIINFMPNQGVVNGTETTVKRLAPNVLTLDYVDVKVGDEERKDVYTWQANRWIFQKYGFAAGNPWDNQVQFKDELITRQFPEDSGFEAVYRFVVEDNAVPALTEGNDIVPSPSGGGLEWGQSGEESDRPHPSPLPEGEGTFVPALAIVIERPDLYTIYVNTEPVAVQPDSWWLDRSFGKIDISKFVKPGENTVKIVANQMSIYHELEPAYLLGNFSLKPAEKGFFVTPPQPLTLKTEATALEERHSDDLEGISWLSAGVGFRPNRPDLADRSPTLTFEFDKEYEVEAIKIWNYCERNLQKRGVKEVEITGFSQTTLPISTVAYAVKIHPARPILTKTVEFNILSNHAGTTFPIPENARPDDNGFVGLAEVQFFARKGEELVPIKNVTVKASSELVVDTHDRRARYLVDGSGLGRGENAQGWHRQGMPFYSDKVEYSRSFEIENVSGTYRVQLPDSPTGWYGATAKVVVNGNDAGYVVSAPWSVDVTEFIKQGSNEVSVQVYGTPKNLLGPHHSGRLRGSAWPGSFHRAPERQPPGAAYDVIGYGLFEPFELISP